MFSGYASSPTCFSWRGRGYMWGQEGDLGRNDTGKQIKTKLEVIGFTRYYYTYGVLLMAQVLLDTFKSSLTSGNETAP